MINPQEPIKHVSFVYAERCMFVETAQGQFSVSALIFLASKVILLMASAGADVG